MYSPPTAVHGAQRCLALLVALVREIRSEHEEEGEHDGDAQVAVQVERDVALRAVGWRLVGGSYEGGA